MNKILSSVLIGTIISSISLSAATAVVGEDVPTADRLSKLYINPDYVDYSGTAALGGENLNSYEHNVSVDFATGVPKEIELVWSSFVNLTSGSKFTLRANNATFALAQEAIICTNAAILDAGLGKVGTMVSVGDTDGSTTMNNMSFRIDDNLLAASLVRDSNVTFMAGSACATGTPLSIISSADACTAISVEIPQAIDDSSQAFTDYTAPAIQVAQTKRLVTVACDVPVCTIDTNEENKVFSDAVLATGINNPMVAAATDSRASEYCPGCEETATGPCTTTITVKNMSDEFNLTALTVTPVFANSANSDVAITLAADGTHSDSNDTGVMGSAITINDINVSNAGGEHNITITYTPTGTSVITEGDVTGGLVFTASNGKVLSSDREAKGASLATFATGGETQFTVPYMNSSYKSMVKVTSLSDSEATISAIVTDQDGTVSPSIDLGTIAAGATGFYFSTQGALKDGADAAGLKNAWSVVFSISAEATVVATMAGPDGGDRAISVF
ncbi:MAG: Unknown protein [uncultured Sulfurovum sp.]|uniref:Uncharacterized protein n=1 Tax=uncultured Sulfurovum sp. TaxID=269237 RepID=A0A6S6TZ97_9BACT|nr:MAG: Unknown protein [uncultured Sulfurovum sp.]